MITTETTHRLLRRGSLAVLALLCSRLNAAEVGSEVRAAVITPIAAGAAGTGTTTYLSSPVMSGIYAGGSITAVSGNRVTDTTATWTDGLYNVGPDRYYLLITSGFSAGWQSDITATLASPRSVDVARSLPASVQVGDRYQVLRHYSVDAAFSGVNATALTSAGNPTEADNILVFDAATQRTTTLFSSNFAGFVGWFDSLYSAAGATPLPAGMGWMVQRKSNVVTQVVWAGLARADSLVRTIQPGVNLIGLAVPGTSATLVNLGLYTGSLTTGVRANASAATADRVVVVNPLGTSLSYFYSNAAGQVGWRDTNGANADAVTFAGGSAFFLERDTTLPAFDWRINP